MLRAATTVTIRVGLGVMVRVRVTIRLGWGKLGLVNGLVKYGRDGVRVRIRVWCRRDL